MLMRNKEGTGGQEASKSQQHNYLRRHRNTTQFTLGWEFIAQVVPCTLSQVLRWCLMKCYYESNLLAKKQSSTTNRSVIQLKLVQTSI
eukprot:5856247-Amphidinium_carterae.1